MIKSVYNWDYLKANLTPSKGLEVLVHIIDLRFFRTIRSIALTPRTVRQKLGGSGDLQNGVSFYFSSLLLLYLISFLNYQLFPESFEFSESSPLDDYWQYIITVPFILTLAGTNSLFFRKERLNYLSHLVVALYIMGQSLIYLSLYFVFIAASDILDEPMVQALVYTVIIFMTLFVVNFRTFERSWLGTFLRSVLGILIGLFVMVIVAGFT